MTLSLVLTGAVNLCGSCLSPLCSAGDDAVGCLNAVADPQEWVMLSALFAFVLHASRNAQVSL